LGVKALPEALAIARQLDLDLVEVAPEANPPVTRIMDYNRFKYESAQRAKESRKKATSTSIKEMKYRPKIGSGDFTTKTRQVSRFLEEGHKVKVTIMFRGREVSHPELGMKILDDLAEQVSSVAKVEAAPKLDGRNMVMVLAPDRRARQAARKAAELAPAAGGTPTGSATTGAADSDSEPTTEVASAAVAPADSGPSESGESAGSRVAAGNGTASSDRPPRNAPASRAPATRAPATTVSAAASAASSAPAGDLAGQGS